MGSSASVLAVIIIGIIIIIILALIVVPYFKYRMRMKRGDLRLVAVVKAAKTFAAYSLACACLMSTQFIAHFGTVFYNVVLY